MNKESKIIHDNNKVIIQTAPSIANIINEANT